MSEHIPLSVLFGDPERVLPSLSPDGTRLAWLAPDGGSLNLWLDDRPLTAAPGRGVTAYRWMADGRHLIWIQDVDGDENWHLHCVDIGTGAVRDLTPHPGVRAQIVAVSPSQPTVVLVGRNERNPRVFDLHRVDVETGVAELVALNDDVESWIVDRRLQLVGATRLGADGRISIDRWDEATGEWTTVLGDAGDDLAFLAYGCASDGSLLIRTDLDAPTRYLARVDLATGAVTTVHRDAVFDVASATVHPQTGDPESVVIEGVRPETVVLDPGVADDIAALDRLEPGRAVVISRDAADRHWLVGFLSDSGPVPHYRWDRDRAAADFLFDHRPSMRSYEWSPMESFAFTARDGLEIHGYLSRPIGAMGPGPGVVNVHGGPWRRNVWGFDPEAQWLANRGMTCVQVNFRDQPVTAAPSSTPGTANGAAPCRPTSSMPSTTSSPRASSIRRESGSWAPRTAATPPCAA